MEELFKNTPVMMTGIVCITILLTTLLVLYKPFSKKQDKDVTKKGSSDKCVGKLQINVK